MKTNEQAMERVKGGGGGSGQIERERGKGKGKEWRGRHNEGEKMGYCVYAVAQI